MARLRGYRALSLMTSCLIMLSATASLAPQDRVSYGSFPPAPSGGILTTRPEIRWTIWGENGATVTKVEMAINGNPVSASYDAAEEAVYYAPPQNLAVGDHQTTCTITLNKKFVVRKAWTFTVLPTAMPALPMPTEEQTLLSSVVNEIRASHGLEPMIDHQVLHHVSNSHAKYMRMNNTISHVQDKSRPGYFGAGHVDRAMLFGYTQVTSEVLSRSSSEHPRAIRQLFDAPYHRLLFLRPGRPAIGAGVAGPYFCMNFGGRGTAGVVCSPPDNATGVPVLWDGNEEPNPLRMTGLHGPVGYPITMSLFRPDRRATKCLSATLKTSTGETVKVFVNQPENDTELRDSIIIIPAKPLNPGQTYTVSATLQATGEEPTTRTWSFKTVG